MNIYSSAVAKPIVFVEGGGFAICTKENPTVNIVARNFDLSNDDDFLGIEGDGDNEGPCDESALEASPGKQKISMGDCPTASESDTDMQSGEDVMMPGEMRLVEKLVVALVSEDVEGFLQTYDDAISDGVITRERVEFLKDIVRELVFERMLAVDRGEVAYLTYGKFQRYRNQYLFATFVF